SRDLLEFPGCGRFCGRCCGRPQLMVVPMTITQTAQDTTQPITLIPAGNDRLVLTVPEAGDLLGISRAFAYELVARGELPVIRLGRRRLVPKRALMALIDPDPATGTREPLPSSFR